MKRFIVGLTVIGVLAIGSYSWGTKFYGQLTGAVFERLADDPSGLSAIEGRFYYNTGDSMPKFYNGSVWTAFNTSETDPTFASVTIDNGATSGGALTLVEDDDNGSSTITIAAPDAVNTTYTITLPADEPTGDSTVREILLWNGTNFIWTPGGARFVGRVLLGEDCAYTRTSQDSWANFSDDASCTASATGDVAVVGSTNAAITVNDLPPGVLQFISTVSMQDNSADTAGCMFRFYDSVTATAFGKGFVYANTVASIMGGLSGTLVKSSYGNHTVYVQGTGDGASQACGVFGTSGAGLNAEIAVFWYPSS